MDGIAAATIDSPPQRSPHFRRVQAAICSSLGAEMGCIGDVQPPNVFGSSVLGSSVFR
jgi:hypothetical protein